MLASLGIYVIGSVRRIHIRAIAERHLISDRDSSNAIKLNILAVPYLTAGCQANLCRLQDESGSLVRILDRSIRRDSSFNRLRRSARRKINPRLLARLPSGELKLVRQPLLIARPIIRQHQHRPRLPVADYPHRRPRVNRSCQPVPPRGHNHNSLAMLRGAVDRRLNRRVVVAGFIAV